MVHTHGQPHDTSPGVSAALVVHPVKECIDGVFSKPNKAQENDLDVELACHRALTEMRQDVKEAREAIAEVADNNAILAAVCLTEKASALDWSQNSHKPLHM